ncbi:MAG TPA: zf-TFIIB domain-containing protein [Gemmatimonadaceae bacterium]|jgi:ssDNA-binding Zn-finger/Zn-ribbon topoisomerase 1|nr:zf-TFIIB domain-containing protein [Gemmatimonadaceae bacterium]
MPTENKPSRNEDEYFAKLDAERVKELRARLDAERAATERKAHFMKCPKCGGQLQEVTIRNVKVDICPDCHGTWLDAGELDMIGAGGENAVSGFLRDILKGIRGK